MKKIQICVFTIKLFTSDICTIPELKYANTSPPAGTKVADGSSVLVICKNGYNFGLSSGSTTDKCDSTLNTLPDCHSMCFKHRNLK